MNRMQRFLILAIMVLLVVGVAGFQPAKAAGQMSYIDNFGPWGANTAAKRWTCENNPAYNQCVFLTTFGRTDTYSVQLLLGWNTDSSNWVGVGRTVTLTVPAPYTKVTSCQAKLWVKNESQRQVWGLPQGNGPGKIEIFNPANWTYLTVRSFNFATDNLNWTLLATNWFTPPGGSIYLRLVALHAQDTNTQLVADDMEVICNLA
jgi:hypothetical protein